MSPTQTQLFKDLNSTLTR